MVLEKCDYDWGESKGIICFGYFSVVLVNLVILSCFVGCKLKCVLMCICYYC